MLNEIIVDDSLKSTIYVVPSSPLEPERIYHFNGDDLYGDYSFDEFIALRSMIWHRITEVIQHKYKYGEPEVISDDRH